MKKLFSISNDIKRKKIVAWSRPKEIKLFYSHVRSTVSKQSDFFGRQAYLELAIQTEHYDNMLVL